MRAASGKDRAIAKGLLAGMIGGLIASWTMNQFQSAVSKIQQAWDKSAYSSLPSNDSARGSATQDSEDATMKTADRLALLLVHRNLTKDEKAKAGPIVHYSYGTLLGCLYGAAAEVMPAIAKGAGTGYAATAWLFGDEIAVPKLGLSGPPSQYPLTSHAQALAAHLVYGVTADAVRRVVRSVI